jgi:hypothetical protein
MPDRCKKIVQNGDTTKVCGGHIVEIPSQDENGRKVVDYLCRRCGDHSKVQLVVENPNKTEHMEDVA